MNYPLYLIFLLISVSLTAQNSKLKFESRKIDHGTVEDWANPPARFVVTNNGPTNLSFLPTFHTQDVYIVLPKKPVPPKGRAEIIVYYYTGDKGTFSKSVEIYSNYDQKPLKLTVKGNIKSFASSAHLSCPGAPPTNDPVAIYEQKVLVFDAETGKPIEGVKVEFKASKREKYGDRTIKGGFALIEMPPGLYKMEVSKGEYYPHFDNGYINRSTGTLTVELKPKPKPVEELAAEKAPKTTSSPKSPYPPKPPQPAKESNDEVEKESEYVVILGSNRKAQEAKEKAAKAKELAERALADADEAKEAARRSREAAEIALADVDEAKAAARKAKEAAEKALAVTEKAAEEKKAEPEPAPAPAPKPKPDPDPEPEPEPVIPEFDERTGTLSEKVFQPNNIVFLIDISLSMKDDNKLAELKVSMKNLAQRLRDIDQLTIITYNNRSAVAMETTSADERDKISAIIDGLVPKGSTRGVKGLEKAYQTALENLIYSGNNQIILATDGKFSEVDTDDKSFYRIAKNGSKEGIVLSVLGFGQDKKAAGVMDKLARAGKGSYYSVYQGEGEEVLLEEIMNRSRKD